MISEESAILALSLCFCTIVVCLAGHWTSLPGAELVLFWPCSDFCLISIISKNCSIDDSLYVIIKVAQKISSREPEVEERRSVYPKGVYPEMGI
jgi:hypothetical protein